MYRGVLILALISPILAQAARNFDGVDDVLNCGSAAVLDNLKAGGGMTIYFRGTPGAPESATLGGYLVSKDDTAGTRTWAFRLLDDNAALNNVISFFHVGSTNLLKTSGTGQWSSTAQSYIMTWDGSVTASNVHFYVNGTETTYDATGPQNGVALVDDAANSLTIGNDASGARSYSGPGAEVAIWSAGAIAANEIASLANGLPPHRAVRSKTLVFWSALGHGSPEPDWSGNASNCTVTGATITDHPRVAPYFGSFLREKFDLWAWFVSDWRRALQTIMIQ